MIFLLVVKVLGFVFDWDLPRRTSSVVAPVEFSSPAASLRGEGVEQVHAAPDVGLVALIGGLVVKGEPAQSLRAATRVPVFTASVTSLLLGLAALHCLWRLCQAGERGDIFSPANPGYVRWYGILSVAAPFIEMGVRAWERVSVAHQLEGRVSVAGLQVLPGSLARSWWDQMAATYPTPYGFDWSSFFTGILALALAEVFRRGLALKQENDLTV